MQPEQSTGLSPLDPPPAREERLAALRRQGEAAQAEVAALLSRARRRAGRLAGARLTLVLAAGLTVALAGGALAAGGAGAQAGRALLALLIGVAIAAAIAFHRRSPLQRAAASAQDPRQLAALLCDPGLGAAGGGAELRSSVELSLSPGPGASDALLSLLHQRAAARARTLDLQAALPGRALRRPAAALLGALLLVALCQALWPRRLALGGVRLWGGEQAAPPAEAEPIAGDLSITYLYPAHTGLPPRTEEGTAGDLRGPKGTEVRLTARADRDVAQAFAVVNGAALALQSGGPGGRALSGSFTLAAPGKWRLRYADAKGRSVAEGPERPVEIVADLAPQVTIEEPAKSETEVDPQGRVTVAWTASDDYGLTQASLVIQRAGEPEERVALQSAPEGGARARKMRGSYAWDLAPLKLRAGDKVAFTVEAFDNDAVDGKKRGVSGTKVLKVFSAAEHHREAMLRAQALWERLVALLADRLDETVSPLPQGREEAKGWYDGKAARDREANALVADLARAGRELGKDKLAPKALGRALSNVAAALSPLVSRTAQARAPLSIGAANKEGAVRSFQAALGVEVKELEKDVLYLEDLLDRARLDAMQELQKELKASRRELARLAEKLRKAPDEATKKAVLAEVARLRERVQELMQRMAEMAKGIRDEHLNREAVESVEKEQDLMSQLSDIQRKMQEGKIDDALKQLDQLSQQLDQLEKRLAEQGDQQQGAQYAEEAKALREAADKLAQLKGREQALEKRTAQLRRETRAAAEKRFQQRGGKELARRLVEKLEQAKRQVAQVEPKVAEQAGLDEQLEMAQGRTEDAKRALQAGDYEEALDQAQRAERAVQVMQGRLGVEEQLQQQGARMSGFGRDPVALRKSLQGVAQAQGPLREVVRELQDALPREGQGLGAEQQKELRAQGEEQRAIQQGFEGVRGQLDEVGKKVPVFGPRHQQMLQEAGAAMERAGQKLSQLDPRGAQAGEAQAVEKIEAFEQAMKELSKQGGGKGGMPMPWGDPQGGEGDEEGSDDGVRKEKVEIPDAESGRGPQEFRKKLLDAMKQPPPERYKERVKQYYEELVK